MGCVFQAELQKQVTEQLKEILLTGKEARESQHPKGLFLSINQTSVRTLVFHKFSASGPTKRLAVLCNPPALLSTPLHLKKVLGYFKPKMVGLKGAAPEKLSPERPVPECFNSETTHPH